MRVIREKTEDDGEQVREVVRLATEDLRRVYKPKLQVPPPHSPQDPRPMKSFVAIEDGRVVGVVDCVVREEEVHIRGLAVHPAWRRRGIARELVERVGATAAALGKARLTLSTIEETGNCKVFARLGFGTGSRQAAPGFEGINGQEVFQVDLFRPLK